MPEPRDTTRRAIRAYGWAGVSTPEQARSEKESIPAQRRDVEAAAERLGVHLIDILEVPGFSRAYLDFHEMNADMLRDGIDAFSRLERLWQDRTIDLFICRDADRFGRTLAILTYIGGQLVHAGARLYLTAKNLFIDRQNYPTLAAISGLMAEDEIARLRARHEMGMKRRFTDGLSGSNPPFSHRLVLVGRERRLVLDDSKEPFWTDLARLLLDGVPYDELAVELARHGHMNPATGKPYRASSLRRYLLSPFTWGNVAFRWDNKHGLWSFDESAPVPAGVQVLRDKIDPVYTGDIAGRVQAELKRRESVIKGKARPQGTHRFTRLMVCDECGYHLTYSSGRYCCPTRWTARTKVLSCANTAYISEQDATGQIGDFLYRWIMSSTLDLPTLEGSNTENTVNTALAALDKEIATLERRIRNLVRKQADAPDAAQTIYDEQIAAYAARLAGARDRRTPLLARAENPRVLAQRKRTRDEIASLGMEKFLTLSDTEINQMLHALLSAARFAVRNGEIIGLRVPE